MFSVIKKLLFGVPLVLMFFFFYSGEKAEAANAELINENGVSELSFPVGNNDEDIYFFGGSRATWEFKAKYPDFLLGESFLMYRVISPDRKATDWIKAKHVDNKGRFEFNRENTAFSQDDVDISMYNSVAPACTYYVEIEYYKTHLYGFFKSKIKDRNEVLKIVDCGNQTPTFDVVVSYNDEKDKFISNTYITINSKGAGIINDMRYMFAEEKTEVVNASSLRTANYLTYNYNSASIELGKPDNTDMKYLYVEARSVDGSVAYTWYDIDNKTSDSESKENQRNQNSDDGGIFDFGFGELILLVLIVILIVSCTLIIVQKIVDYKKKLY